MHLDGVPMFAPASFQHIIATEWIIYGDVCRDLEGGKFVQRLGVSVFSYCEICSPILAAELAYNPISNAASKGSCLFQLTMRSISFAIHFAEQGLILV